jgi:hypothetical protein
VHPELVALLADHLGKYRCGPGGRIFTGPRGGIFNDRAYIRIFHEARAAAFAPSEAASVLARRPSDLQHAAVSTWRHSAVGTGGRAGGTSVVPFLGMGASELAVNLPSGICQASELSLNWMGHQVACSPSRRSSQASVWCNAMTFGLTALWTAPSSSLLALTILVTTSLMVSGVHSRAVIRWLRRWILIVSILPSIVMPDFIPIPVT